MNSRLYFCISRTHLCHVYRLKDRFFSLQNGILSSYFIESNPVLSPRTKSKPPWDLYWIFANTEVSLCLGINLARQYMSMLYFAGNVETTGSDRHNLIPHCLIPFLYMAYAYEIVWIYSSNTVLNIFRIIAFKYFSMSFYMLSYCSGKLLQKLWWIWW